MRCSGLAGAQSRRVAALQALPNQRTAILGPLVSGENLLRWIMETMKLKLGLLAAMALIVAAGCNKTDQDNLTQDTQKMANHAGEALSSEALGTKVKTALAMRKSVDDSKLTINAEHGVVTMSGTVKDEAERKLVIDTVDGIKGVDKTIDKLTVGK